MKSLASIRSKLLERDDISGLSIPKSAKKYARMTSKDLKGDWGAKKFDAYVDMVADLTGQQAYKHNFANIDKSGKTKNAIKGIADSIIGK